MKKILTVDDSKVLRMMVARHLQTLDVEVLEAADGREGLATARREHPDLILLDVTMPEMDGREALTAIRRDPALATTPVIMLTAESGKELVVDLARLGVQGYIVKPFDAATFHAQIAKVLGPDDRSMDSGMEPGVVLVVDDSERVLESARAALTDFTVVTATTGASAVALWAERRPGVVVLDLVMPELDGFQTKAQIVQRGGGASRFVALTLRGDADAQRRALAEGFVAVVEKPLKADALRAVLGGLAGTPPPILEHHEGCPVLVVPDSQAPHFGQFGASAREQLRSLAEDGDDRVILDLASVRELNAEVTRTIVTVLERAAEIGLRTAVCSESAEIIERLKSVRETSQASFSANRPGALQELQ